jgi:hypothetical protein
MTLAEAAATALNRILYELSSTARKNDEVRHYCDVGIWGYGLRPSTGDQGVEPAFSGALANQTLVPLPIVYDNPLAVRPQASEDVTAPSMNAPVWVEAVHGRQTPMCEAVATAGAFVHSWAATHPRSFPPVFINITDGWVSDSPFKNAPLRDWVGRITSIRTTDGPALFFNVFIAPDSAGQVLFPATPAGLPDPGPDLFGLSSPLPPMMIQRARGSIGTVPDGARGFGFNADLIGLIKFLKIGTTVV